MAAAPAICTPPGPNIPVDNPGASIATAAAQGRPEPVNNQTTWLPTRRLLIDLWRSAGRGGNDAQRAAGRGGHHRPPALWRVLVAPHGSRQLHSNIVNSASAHSQARNRDGRLAQLLWFASLDAPASRQQRGASRTRHHKLATRSQRPRSLSRLRTRQSEPALPAKQRHERSRAKILFGQAFSPQSLCRYQAMTYVAMSGDQ